MSSLQKELRSMRVEFDSTTEDIQPKELRSCIRGKLDNTNLTPTLLCIFSSRLSGETIETSDVVGVQLMHTGLEIIRDILDRPDPWENVDLDPVEEDMELLAADVMISLGLGLLDSHYKKAIRIVNEFGTSKAKIFENGFEDFDELLEQEATEHVEAYTTATEIGFDDDPPQNLLESVEYMAFVHALSECKTLRDHKKAQEYMDKYYERAIEGVRGEGYYDDFRKILDGDLIQRRKKHHDKLEIGD